MTTVEFVGGPYDGASFSFAARMPDTIDLHVVSAQADFVGEAGVNAPQEGSSGSATEDVVTPDTSAVFSRYTLNFDALGAPFYRFDESEQVE